VTLTGTNCVFDVPDSAAALNLNGIIGGSGSLVKTGLGIVSLLSSNSYTGNVTVSGGTLTVANPDLAASATVTISNSAVLSLNYTDGPATNIVAALVQGGISQPPGIYNSDNDSIYIAGSGSLMVAPPAATLSGLQFIGSPMISGTSLTISATNTGAGTVYLLTSTNVAAPISTWTPIWTNVLNGSGSFTTNLSDAVNPALNHQFYLLSNTNN
jgi:autotransporter-associated beta strand protein